MSAREAYIAGRSGGSRPSRGSGSSSGPGSSTQRARVDEVRQQQAYDAGQQEREREQILQSDQGIAGLPQDEREQAKTIAENTKKDPYDTLTREEEIQAGYPKTALEKLQEASGVKLFNPTLQFMGIGAKTFGTLLDSVFKPKASTFKGQNNLSIIKNLVKPENLFDYYNTYRDVINEAGFDTGSDFIKAIESAPEFGVQGTESQRRANPASYYDKDLFVDSGEQDEMLKDYPEFLEKMGLKPMSSRFANTTGNLVDIANIPVTPEMQGNNPEFAKRIFEARMELDRMGRDSSGNPQGSANQGGGGGTYVPPTTTPDDPIIPQDPTLPPGVTPPTTTPKYPGSVVTDYTQLGLPNIYGNQQMPNYGNFYQGQGGQPIGLQNYLDNLKKRFGIG